MGQGSAADLRRGRGLTRRALSRRKRSGISGCINPDFAVGILSGFGQRGEDRDMGDTLGVLEKVLQPLLRGRDHEQQVLCVAVGFPAFLQLVVADVSGVQFNEVVLLPIIERHLSVGANFAVYVVASHDGRVGIEQQEIGEQHFMAKVVVLGLPIIAVDILRAAAVVDHRGASMRDAFSVPELYDASIADRFAGEEVHELLRRARMDADTIQNGVVSLAPVIPVGHRHVLLFRYSL